MSMKIYIRLKGVLSGDFVLKEIEATAVKEFDSIAIAHVDKKWYVYDIPTGFYIVSGTTKKMAIENLYLKKEQLEKVRASERYQRLIREFEDMNKI